MNGKNATLKNMIPTFKQRFFKFLKENNAYEIYMLNLKKRKVKNSEIKSFFMNCYYKDVIAESFNWKGTPQGFDYWFQLNEKWVDAIHMPNVRKNIYG